VSGLKKKQDSDLGLKISGTVQAAVEVFAR